MAKHKRTRKMQIVKLRISVVCTFDVDCAGKGMRSLPQIKKELAEDIISDDICETVFRSPDCYIGPVMVGKPKIDITRRKEFLKDDEGTILDFI